MAIRDATPWPAIGCPAAPSGLAMTVKSGDTVACGLLDPPRLKWVRFAWPEFGANARSAARQGAIAMLSLTVDENGTVIDASPRGTPDNSSFLAAALSAARKWQTTPPRAQGKPVKTEFAVDLPSIP
jgi:TonB family protein